MGINIFYMVAAYYIFNRFKPKIFQGAHLSSMWAELFLASIFLVFGAILFDIPIGFFGMNNPHITDQLKEKWWAAPGITLSFLLFSLSFKNSFEAFKKARFTTTELKKLSIGSTLFGAAVVAVFFVFGIKNHELSAEEEKFFLTFWWGFWLVFTILHFFVTFLIQGIRSSLGAKQP